MKVYYTTEDIVKSDNAVVTVGSYDGLHYGHRALLDVVRSRAVEIDGQSVVVTFWPHPRQVLARGGDVKLLNTLKEKLFLLEEIGIDVCVVLPFDAKLAAMTAAEFVGEILVGRIGMKYFVVGYNHHLGSDHGDFFSMLDLQPKYGFVSERVSRRDVGNEKVSSTVVRNVIAEGNMELAHEMLTRGYIVIGDLCGDGRVIIEDKAKLLPAAGEYAVKVSAHGNSVPGILYVGGDGTLRLSSELSGEMKDVMMTFE